MNKDKQILLTEFGKYFQQLVQDMEDIKEHFKQLEFDAENRLRCFDDE